MRKCDIIGLIPCGGHATRIAPLPCSKEILPVGFRQAGGSSRPKVISHFLLENMRLGGVTKAFFILRKGKWDIPEYYGGGAFAEMNLGYLVAALPYGPPYTLDEAYPFIRESRVAMGFPDILLEPENAFARAFQKLTDASADVVLGLYRVRDHQSSDMIDVDRGGVVRNLIIKPTETKLTMGWMFAVWTPVFTEFLHDYLATPRTSTQLIGANLPAELTVGHVLQSALREGIRIQTVSFPRDRYLDIGTPAAMRMAAVGKWPKERQRL